MLPYGSVGRKFKGVTMKRADFFLLILVLILISYSFLTVPSDVVRAQDSSSSSSSSGEVTSSSSSSGDVSSTSSSGSIEVILNKNFTGIWKAKVLKSKPPTGNSSGGASSTSSSSSGEATSTSSSGGIEATRKAHLDGDSGNKGASIISFKLCVKDGKLEGVIHQGGTFLNGVIKEQTIISENEVEFLAEDKEDRTAMIHLKLTGERQFIGRFEDGHEFEGRKLNDNRGGCLAPRKGPAMGTIEEPTTSSGGFIMGGPSSMNGPSDSGTGMGTPLNMDGPPDISGTGEPPSMNGPTMSGPGMSGLTGMSEPGNLGEPSSDMSEPPFSEPPGSPMDSMGMF